MSDESGGTSTRRAVLVGTGITFVLALAVWAAIFYAPEPRTHEPLQETTRPGPSSSGPAAQPPEHPGGPENAAANKPPYLPLVEPYEHLKDLLPGTPTGDFAARLDKLVRGCPPGRKRRSLATLRVRLDYLASTAYAAYTLKDLAAKLDEVLAGRDPFASERGNSLRGYYAANDDSCQPYSLTLPEGYDPEGSYPLVLFLHHHGWSDWYRPFQGHPAPQLAGAIVAAPHGRGSCDYLWIAEDDSLAVLDATIADLAVDGARVYATGWSMGGTGSLHLPGRYPDRFAASCPKAGNADFTAWEEAWKEDRQQKKTPLLEPRMFLRWKTAPVTYAENFLHVPMALDHGELDSINPVGHSKSMAGRLRALGYEHVRFRSGQGGHGWGATLEERLEWMKEFRLNPRPARVRLKTGDYRHGSAYWVTIARLADRMKMAEIDVRVAAADRIEVTKCENIERFTLRLDGLELAADAGVTIGGRQIPLPRPRPAAITLVHPPADAPVDGAAWTIMPDLPAGLPAEPQRGTAKRKGLEGPIHDAFREPFLAVVGTTAKDPFERGVIHEEAERWRRQWQRRFQVWPPVKLDREVTEEDIASKNLLVFGGPQANSVAARLMAKLPVRIEGRTVKVGRREYEGDDLGLKLVYPNPLNIERLVVIQAATTWRGMWQMSHRFGNWFDWMPLENRDWFDFCVFDDRSSGFETFLDVGFFDEDWSLRRANRWHGVEEWRAKAQPRAYPGLREPPEADEVRLSDLWPTQIDTAKGPLQINRSFNGLDICIGRERQESGLGLWIESAVVYDLDARYRTFTTRFGIDAEGQEKISDARRDAERVHFEVWGDSRLLAEERSVRFGDPPHGFEVDVTGVHSLTLRVLRQTPQGWLYGPVTWGQPTLRK